MFGVTMTRAAGVVRGARQGRAACEIDTADELLTTELMFHNAFVGLSVPQFVAVVSCLIPCEKSEDMVRRTP